MLSQVAVTCYTKPASTMGRPNGSVELMEPIGGWEYGERMVMNTHLPAVFRCNIGLARRNVDEEPIFNRVLPWFCSEIFKGFFFFGFSGWKSLAKGFGAEVRGWFDVADQLSAGDFLYDCAATGSCGTRNWVPPSLPQIWCPWTGGMHGLFDLETSVFITARSVIASEIIWNPWCS